MSEPMALISLRLPHPTLNEIHTCIHHPERLHMETREPRQPNAQTRSELIRHLIRTGLDTLKNSPPLNL